MTVNRYDVEIALMKYLGIDIEGCTKAVITISSQHLVQVEATYEIFPSKVGEELKKMSKSFKVFEVNEKGEPINV